ncbi:MAG: hypothetical protein AAFQ13_07595, partial [Pseudomonadota bacterium]
MHYRDIRAWTDWTTVTNFAVETGFLNDLREAANPGEAKKRLSDEQAIGIVRLYSDQIAHREPLRQKHDLSVFERTIDSRFWEFLCELPNSLGFLIDHLNFRGVRAKDPTFEGKYVRTSLRGIWALDMLEFYHNYEEHVVLRTAYCLGYKLMVAPLLSFEHYEELDFEYGLKVK